MLVCCHKQISGNREFATRNRALQAGFTILELITVVAILTVLMALLLPAIAATRESARRIQCTNQLRQIGIALHEYHELNRTLPSGLQWEETGQSAYGWTVPLLSFLEQSAIENEVHTELPLQNALNQTACSESISSLLCPSDITQETFLLFHEVEATQTMLPLIDLPTASYVGVFGTLEADDDYPVPKGDGTFLDSDPVRFSELRRGLSNTIIVGERKMETVPSTWLGVQALGEDAPCRLVGSAMTSPNCSECDECEFTSRHAGGVNFLWGDGHVKLIGNGIHTNLYRELSQRNPGH
ncbi:MAG: DUF1559 domain-containing protein [Planctomycetaceae bacterium]|nr:DUF1559 domain-containing protein [Planctomycetaceae bacterium]